MVVYISVLAALIGVLMYGMCANAKLQEVGRIMFFCGFLVLLFSIDRLVSVVPATK